jgi:hypothetical protein
MWGLRRVLTAHESEGEIYAWLRLVHIAIAMLSSATPIVREPPVDVAIQFK